MQTAAVSGSPICLWYQLLLLHVVSSNPATPHRDNMARFLRTDGGDDTPAGGNQQKNISFVLNNLLVGYDNRVRPDYGSAATTVKVDVNIRSMGPISEVDMAYSLDAYFRQTWQDRRLRFEGPLKEMAVHIRMLELIWKPDTFFYNGQGSYLHTTTTPNKLLRIRQDGTILYSMRLTIKATCPMYLQHFPVDEQLCPLELGSYAYTRDQLEYVWKHGRDRSIKISKDMKMSQFDLTGHPTGNRTISNRTGQSTGLCLPVLLRSGRTSAQLYICMGGLYLILPGEFSTLLVSFKLQRHMGYFLIQVYVPCTLIVILSWVSFWIHREATADRVGLGITSVLTLTTVTLDSRNDLPKVQYATALDWFIMMCYCFVIGSLLEFAGVHYFTKHGSGEKLNVYTLESEQEDNDEEAADKKRRHSADQLTDGTVISNKAVHAAIYWAPKSQSEDLYNVDREEKNGTARGSHAQPTTEQERGTTSCFMKFLLCLQGNEKYRKLMRGDRDSQNKVNSVSTIDRVSRILFPMSFTILNIIYWMVFTR